MSIFSPMFSAGARRWCICFFAIASLLVTGVAFYLDDAVIRWVRAHQIPSIKYAAGLVSHYGDWPFLMALALPLAFLLAKLGRRRWMHIVCLMMIASTLAGVAVNVARLTTGRTRPNAENAQIADGWYGPRHDGKWTIGNNRFNAFPSGHTATAIGFFVPLLLLAPRIGGPAFILGLLIGASRIYLGAHHLSDVVVASIAGWAVAVLVCRKWPEALPFLVRTSQTGAAKLAQDSGSNELASKPEV